MDVQATLLYRSLRSLDFAAMVAAVNELIGAPDMQLQMTQPGADGSILFTNPQFHVLVTARNEKFPSSLLQSALDAPITQIKDYDFPDAIQAHRQFLTVTVGNGPVQVNNNIREWMGRMGTAAADAPYPIENKLVMLNAFVQFLVDHDTPECVHWAQSDMIFSPQEIMEARDMPFPLPLVVRPTPIIDTDDMGLDIIGLRLEQSEVFLGRTMVCEPSTLPFGEVMGITMWLMSERIQDRLSLHHGATLETPGFPTLYLRHEAPDAADAQGRVVLTQVQPISERENTKFNFAGARWNTPRPSEQGHEHIPARVIHAHPAPVATSAPDFVSDRVQQAPAYAAPAAPAAPALEVVEAKAEPAPAEAAPVEAAVEVVAEAPKPAAPQAGNSIASALSKAAATPPRTAVAAAPAQPFAKPAAQPSAASLTAPAALTAAAEDKTKRKSGIAGLIPMRAIASVAAVCLVLAASLTMLPKIIGDDVTVADITKLKSNSSLTVLAGPRSAGN
ncbi:hypothetical protein [Pseudoprimorskyibacter insulae]|uniref:Uncharacterized protein n=1 Tax=Pseudoprimorskyibacter insulae TaxID=1695997 RepID=A0A2R8AY05_9RHOB|nr:hypothetical protein [Pseudoprimorskyibacter insulae]SPF80857.1 hypothetical protein PRI8871_02670 [Pseudoprimorskyibacter insulae]